MGTTAAVKQDAELDALFAPSGDGVDRGTQRVKVLEYLRDAQGAVHTDIDEEYKWANNTASKRLSELEKRGFVMRLMERRKTTTGFTARVYVLTPAGHRMATLVGE
jgi:DNA-binding MarR family transcriptional regulator